MTGFVGEMEAASEKGPLGCTRTKLRLRFADVSVEVVPVVEPLPVLPLPVVLVDVEPLLRVIVPVQSLLTV